MTGATLRNVRDLLQTTINAVEVVMEVAFEDALDLHVRGLKENALKEEKRGVEEDEEDEDEDEVLRAPTAQEFKNDLAWLGDRTNANVTLIFSAGDHVHASHPDIPARLESLIVQYVFPVAWFITQTDLNHRRTSIYLPEDRVHSISTSN